MRTLALFTIALAGCTQLLGLDNLHQNTNGADATILEDGASLDGASGPSIKISGKATFFSVLQLAEQPAAGAMIELLRVGDETVVTSTTADDMGAFSFTIPAGSDVMLRSTFGLAPVALLLPSAPPTADADFSFTMFSDEALTQTGAVCPGNPNGIDKQRGQVFVFVADASNTPQAGYRITSDHAGELTCYLGGGGSTTTTQGSAIVFDVIPTLNAVTASGAANDPPVRSRAWTIPAHSQSFIRLEVPPLPQP